MKHARLCGVYLLYKTCGKGNRIHRCVGIRLLRNDYFNNCAFRNGNVFRRTLQRFRNVVIFYGYFHVGIATSNG